MGRDYECLQWAMAGRRCARVSIWFNQRKEVVVAITWNSRIIADVTFRGVHGSQAAGAYLLRLSVGFAVANWPQDELMPAVLLTSAAMQVEHVDQALLLGHARPETPVPFKVGIHSQPITILYELLLTPSALEAVERLRGGGPIQFRLKIQAHLTRGDEAFAANDDVQCSVSQSDWIAVLEQMGYRKTLLLELPIPQGDEGSVPQRHLETARSHMLRGHYEDAVASCRKALEGWTTQRAEVDAVKKARETKRTASRSLTLFDRELLLRDAATNFADLAHHADEVASAESYGREDAAMIVAITAAILCRRGA